MKFVIGGGTGLIGRALIPSLRSAGHYVNTITRTPKAPNDLSWDAVRQNGLPGDTEVIINLSGRSIGEVNPLFCVPSYYQQYLREVRSSRIDSTKLLVKAASTLPIKLFINASAIGFYRPDLDITYTEEASYQDYGMIGRLVYDWEKASQFPDSPGGIASKVRQYQLRLGVVLARDSNFVKSLYPTHRFGLSGALGSGRQWISWIHLDDVVSAIEFLIAASTSVPTGPVNLTAPEAQRQADLSREFAKAVNAPKMPFGLPAPKTPAFVIKFMMCDEERSSLVLEGQRVAPQKLLSSGFHFKYPKLADALASVFPKI